jgi:hypothetical protein
LRKQIDGGGVRGQAKQQQQQQTVVPLCKHFKLKGVCQVQGCRLRHHFAGPDEEARAAVAAAHSAKQAETAKQINSGDDPHEEGDKKAHSARAAEFVHFLISTFGGPEALEAGTGVMDVAGGKGMVAMQLALAGVPTTVIDGRPAQKLYRSKRKALAKVGMEAPTRLERLFLGLDETDQAFLNDVLNPASLFVGMHADEATEPIVDFAMSLGAPFAVVPCCVFPTLFSRRRLPDGRCVNTTSELIDYLVAKDPDNIHTRFLPFEGRNRVVYSLGSKALGDAVDNL